MAVEPALSDPTVDLLELRLWHSVRVGTEHMRWVSVLSHGPDVGLRLGVSMSEPLPQPFGLRRTGDDREENLAGSKQLCSCSVGDKLHLWS